MSTAERMADTAAQTGGEGRGGGRTLGWSRGAGGSEPGVTISTTDELDLPHAPCAPTTVMTVTIRFGRAGVQRFCLAPDPFATHATAPRRIVPCHHPLLHAPGIAPPPARLPALWRSRALPTAASRPACAARHTANQLPTTIGLPTFPGGQIQAVMAMCACVQCAFVSMCAGILCGEMGGVTGTHGRPPWLRRGSPPPPLPAAVADLPQEYPVAVAAPGTTALAPSVAAAPMPRGSDFR